MENAVRYNEPDGWLSVHTGRSAESVTLTVSNTGRRSPSTRSIRIFEPFRRLGGERTGTGRSNNRGFGLGLSIVRAVARAHGGEVDARPRPGGGLVVTVRLPVGDDRRTVDRRAALPGVGVERRPDGVVVG